MCIIIDINTLASVFDVNSEKHSDFSPVYHWIRTGKGKILYGGTKYYEELKKAHKYLNILLQYRKAGKAMPVNDDDVDREMIFVSDLIQHPDFDDQHIVGLLRASKCKLICSLDDRAYPFFTHQQFFSKKDKPKIYCSSRNKKLLSDNNIADYCKPCLPTTNSQSNILDSIKI